MYESLYKIEISVCWNIRFHLQVSVEIMLMNKRIKFWALKEKLNAVLALTLEEQSTF